MLHREAAMADADNPGVIAPPPLIAGATVLLGLILDWVLPAYILAIILPIEARIVIGVLLVAGGAWLAFAAERAFKAAGTNVPPWKPALNLAASGPYQYMRNPMYVGTALIVAGIGIALASDWTLVLLLPAGLLLHYGVVLREERYLEAKFGDGYRRFKLAVPRYGWPV
jgi:protein-S-isoprenylcysteine O-methyltransferase Ste14